MIREVAPTTALYICAYHFTGKERDAESGLDYFGARYYASSMGRWMSPDPSGLMYADPTNPQSLNLYSYVLNNPLRFIDPTGLTICNWGHSDNNSGAADGNDYDNDDDCVADGGKLVQDTETVNVNSDNGGNAEEDLDNASSTTILQYQTWMGNPYLSQVDPDQARIRSLVKGVAQRTAWFPTVCSVGGYVQYSYGAGPLAQGVSYDSNSGVKGYVAHNFIPGAAPLSATTKIDTRGGTSVGVTLRDPDTRLGVGVSVMIRVLPLSAVVGLLAQLLLALQQR